MEDNGSILSKVLVLDSRPEAAATLKQLHDECRLVAIRPQREGVASVMAILRSNLDLGGIMVHRHYGGTGQGVELARFIRDSRPELPIFLRLDAADADGLDSRDGDMFRCVYSLDDVDALRASLAASIFNRHYPTALVRGIGELTQTALAALFPGRQVEADAPYLVKDRLIHGEVSTLMSIESSWCRGYMMLQAAEADLLDLLPRNFAALNGAIALRELNGLLGEATNMIWGAFKNRYIGSDDTMRSHSCIQVPIVVNHERRFISFGSEDPQLCLKYVLRDREDCSVDAVVIHQRFVFNLSWTPEDMTETASAESMLASGELELF